MISIGAIERHAKMAGLRLVYIRTFVGWPTYWEFSDLLHRIFVLVHKLIEILPRHWHINMGRCFATAR